MSKAITSVFQKLTLTQLKRMAKVEGIELEDDPDKKEIANALAVQVFDIGVRMLTAKMSKVDLNDAVTGLDIDFGEIENPKKVVLSKRLNEQLANLGMEKYLTKHASNDVISRFADLLEVEFPKNFDLTDEDSKKEAVSQITERVYFFGNQSLLDRFDIPFLQSICKEYGLKGETNTKSKLVYALSSQTNIKDLPSFNPGAQAANEARMEAALESANKSKRPSISKGVSYQDMFQLYNLDELVDWCRDNDLKVSGKKPDVIKRILAFLDGDKENTMSTANNKPAEKKTEKKQEKKPVKKAASPKKTEKKQEKEAKPEQEEAAEEEEEEEEEEEQEEAAEEDTEEVNSAFKGMVIALTGELSVKRNKVIEAIEAQGGKYATSVTKAVTHIITDKPDSDSKKLTDAKANGVKIVDEAFISKYL